MKIPTKTLEITDFLSQVSKNSLSPTINLGYSGYVPSIKAENVFGESYGKTTGASVSGSIPQGFIQTPEEKY